MSRKIEARRRRRVRWSVLAASSVVGASARPAVATSASWSAAVSGNFSDGTKWSGGVAPVNQNDYATIAANGSTYTVSVPSPVSNDVTTLSSSTATLSIGPGSYLASYTFNATAGTITGGGTVKPENLYFGTATGGTFLFDGTEGGGSVSGTIPAGDTLIVSPSATDVNTGLAIYSAVNNGTIHLTSSAGTGNSAGLSMNALTNNGLIAIDPDPNSASNTRTLAGTLTNATTGIVSINTSTGTGGSSPAVLNSGTFTVAAAAGFQTANFNQSAGTFNLYGSLNASNFNLSGGTLNLAGGITTTNFNDSGGTIVGSGTINTSSIAFGTAGTAGTFNVTTSVKGNIPAGATVLVQGSSQVSLPTTETNAGTIHLITASNYTGSPPAVGASSGTLTNTGTVQLDPAAGVSNGTVVSANLTGSILNGGTITANALLQISSNLTNIGTVNAPGGLYVGGTLNQAAGTLSAGGGVSAATFCYSGGSVTGTVSANIVNLSAGTSSAPLAATINLVPSVYGYSPTVSGDIPAAAVVTLDASTANYGNAAATFSTGANGITLVNNGTIRLGSVYGSNNSLTLTVTSLTNQGLLTIDPDPAGVAYDNRSIKGPVVNATNGIVSVNVNNAIFTAITNLGAFNIAGGDSATVPGGTFNQAGGTLTDNGGLGVGEFDFNGGTIAGSGAIYASTLILAPGVSPFNGFVLNGTAGLLGSSAVTTTIPAGMSIQIGAVGSIPGSANTTSYSLTNNGQLHLASTADNQFGMNSLNFTGAGLSNNGLLSIDPDTTSPMALPSYTFNRAVTGTVVNNPGGTIAVNTNANISSVVNYGTFNLATAAAVNLGTFNQAGGTATVNGNISTGTFIQSGGTLNVANGSMSVSNFNLAGGTVIGSTNVTVNTTLTLTPTIPAGTVFTTVTNAPAAGTVPAGVDIVFMPFYPSYQPIFSSGLVNNGRIDVDATLPTNVVTNNGVLSIAGKPQAYLVYTTITNNAGGTLELGGQVDTTGSIISAGSIVVTAGTTVVGNQSSVQETAGLLDVEGTFSAGYFSYTGGTISGAGTFELPYSLTVGPGPHTIDAPAAGYFSQTNINATGNLTFTKTVALSGPTIINGPGAVTFAGPLSAAAGASLNVAGGTVTLSNDPGPNLALTVGGTVVFSPTAGSPLLQLSSLSIAGTTNAWTGQLDLTNHDLDITGGQLATITNQIASGYNLPGGAAWNGTGIVSSTAAGDTTHLTALGVVQNNQGGSPLFTAAAPFDGITPGTGDILVKYTYFGDANLDGVVDGSDYSLIDAGYASNGTLTGWYYGDFNYDGVIDGSDYALIDNAFNNQTGVIGSSGIAAVETAETAVPAAAVPEPAGIAGGLAGVIGVAVRRRRR